MPRFEVPDVRAETRQLAVPAADYDALVAQVAGKADTSAIPAPATTMPPGVTDGGAIGTQSPYARSDHTHASRARKLRITGINTATYTWTYATPFTTGVVPIIAAMAEDPANAAADSYNVQVVGTPTATSCQLRIIRASSGLLLTLLGALSLNSTPGNINLHLIALEP